MDTQEQDNLCVHVDVAGMRVEWDADSGQSLWGGVPSVSMFIPSSLKALMVGFHRMAGTERFNLALESGGREGVEDDWRFLSTFSSFEKGFAALGTAAAAAGWGRWYLLSLDRDRREARFRVVNCWEGLYQRMLGVCWGSSVMRGKLAGYCAKLFDTSCEAEQTAFLARGDPHDEFLVRPSNTTFDQQVEALLEEDKATRADLAEALGRLRREIAERAQAEAALQRSEQELRDKLRVIERQQGELRALSTPILQVWRGVLAVPLIGTLDTRRAAELMESLLDAIVRTGSQHTILDMTGIEEVDAHAAERLARIVAAIGLLGARGVIAGIRPAVAATMTSAGVDLSNIATVSNLEEGLKLCMNPGKGSRS